LSPSDDSVSIASSRIKFVGDDDASHTTAQSQLMSSHLTTAWLVPYRSFFFRSWDGQPSKRHHFVKKLFDYFNGTASAQ
jgi:hypothetical protein